ncbi:sigma-70 family RNA polymerase sigma factor, partial [Streptomyces alkaliphilus]|uniref:sigma-70 family RNA polymerase sigma factor n=1 Tax=Streptomyces alkaliphilus TaxID=1472722 RepID=UPI003F66B6A6
PRPLPFPGRPDGGGGAPVPPPAGRGFPAAPGGAPGTADEQPSGETPPRRNTRGERDSAVTALALAAGRGDREALEAFVRETRKDVWRFTAHLSGDLGAADDLTQETYLRALRGLASYEGRSCARSWLLSIARRAVVDRYRSAARRPVLAAAEDWRMIAERTQPRGVPGFDEGVALRELLELLPAERQEAFVLTRVLGLPYAEAARVIGCPIGTVRSRVARARADLMEALTPVSSGVAVAA